MGVDEPRHDHLLAQVKHGAGEERADFRKRPYAMDAPPLDHDRAVVDRRSSVHREYGACAENHNVLRCFTASAASASRASLRLRVETPDLVEDDVRELPSRADGVGVIQSSTSDAKGVAPEQLAIVVGLSMLLADPQQFRNLLIGVQPIGNKKWHNNDICREGPLRPSAHERLFLQKHPNDLGVLAAGLDSGGLRLDREPGVFVERCAVSYDHQRRVSRIDAGGNLPGSAEQDFGHPRVVPHRFAILERPGGQTIPGGQMSHRTGQAKFPRDDFPGKIAFADEIRDDIDLPAFHRVECLTEAWLLLPEAANHLVEYPPAPNFLGMQERWSAGTPVHARSMTQQQQGAPRLLVGGMHRQKTC